MAELADRCPGCSGLRVRYGSSAVRHAWRVLAGSRKRYCVDCGLKWISKCRRFEAHPLTGPELRRVERAGVAAALGVVVVGAVLRLGGALASARRPRPSYRAAYALPEDASGPDTYRYPFLLTGVLRVSSRFGYRNHPILKRCLFHSGVDLAMPWGTPVYPARNGEVIAAGWAGGYGYRVIVRHADGESTVYGHLAHITTDVGDVVVAGQTMIGRVGSTGLSTGPHLHFEVRDSRGMPYDPDSILSLPERPASVATSGR